MTFRNPDFEIHLTGWPAVIFAIALGIPVLGGILTSVDLLLGLL